MIKVTLDQLVGHVLTGVWVEDDLMTLELDGGYKVAFEVTGDCCSRSHYRAIGGANNVLGKRLVSVEPIDMDPKEEDNGGDLRQFYGYRFSAEPVVVELEHIGQGVKMEVSQSMVVEFYNDSNGYYGGEMEAGVPVAEALGTKVEEQWNNVNA